jgi:glycogen synthase
MKVLFLANEYPPNVYGGAGVHLKNLSRELAKIIPSVEVRYFGSDERHDGSIKVKGYRPWEYLDCKMNPKFNSALRTLSINLAWLSDGVDADIVHTHTWYAHFAGYLAKMLYKCKFIATSHSIEPLRPWKYDQLGEAYTLSSWMEKVGLENADRVVAVSKMMKEDILKYFNISPDKVVVIHNGIDLNVWKPTPISNELKETYGIKDDYILFVGRPTKQKGMEYLVAAADYIDVQIVFAAVGADTKEYEDEMKRKVAEKKNILWINKMLKEEEYVQLYSSAKVFVCPSIYEPFGIINLEAMSCETPVVASAVGGILEVVVHEETGLLVDPGNPKQIAEAVNRLLKDENLRRKLGKNGRERVEKYFSWERIAQQTKALYEEVLL